MFSGSAKDFLVFLKIHFCASESLWGTVLGILCGMRHCGGRLGPVTGWRDLSHVFHFLSPSLGSCLGFRVKTFKKVPHEDQQNVHTGFRLSCVPSVM